jgi:hypothetical protein
MGISIKTAAFPLVAAAVLVATATVSGITNSHQNAELQGQRDKLTAVTQKVDAARAATAKTETISSLDALGASSGRVNADEKILDDLVQRTLTWDSDASYRDARASTMRVYGLTEDSPFMKAFLPPAPVNRDSKGNEYPYIDAAGLNSAVADSTVKLLAVDGVSYSYMVLVDVQATSSDGLGTSGNVATIFATIDGDGSVSKVSGFASTQKPLTSD